MMLGCRSAKRRSLISLALLLCTIYSLIGLARARNCKTFYFHAEIYVAGISSCSNRQRKRLGSFINRVINDAFKNINVISFNAKVCSTPIEYYSDDQNYWDDDGYNNTDNGNRRRDLMPFLEPDSRIFLPDTEGAATVTPNQTSIQISKALALPAETTPMIEETNEENYVRLLRFGEFYYIGGGACRFCLRDDWDSRRSLTYVSASISSSGGRARGGASSSSSGRAYAYSGGSGSFSVSATSSNAYSSTFHYSTTYSWKQVQPQLEQNLSKYLTRAVKDRYRRRCIRRRSLKVSVELTRKRRKRDSRRQC